MIRVTRNKTARTYCAAPAAPAGGARLGGGRGCGFGTAARSLFALVLSLSAQPVVAGDPVMVPSGQMIILSEVLLDEAPGELWARFRFVAPQIDSATGSISYDQAGPDMDFLCTTLALPYLRDHALTPAMVVISLMEFVVPFGTQDPEATQFFEAYRPDADGCIWEAL